MAHVTPASGQPAAPADAAAATAPADAADATPPVAAFGAMPKADVQAPDLLAKWPAADGRGVTIFILDTGVDPGAVGLAHTPDGRPKVIDVRDCTGSGDVVLGPPVAADADGWLPSAAAPAKRLRVNAAWANPAATWRVGYKRAYDLFAAPLVRRFKAARAAAFDDAHAVALSKAAAALAAVRADKDATKKAVAEAEAAVAALEAERAAFHADGGDAGPAVDVVVWHDGAAWRCALDTTDLAIPGRDPASGAQTIELAACPPLTNFAAERQYVTLDARSALSVAANFYGAADADACPSLELVADAGAHGTHVAGIAAAFHPDAPDLNGVAPGAQIVSLKIGDTRLGSMETGAGLMRAAAAMAQIMDAAPRGTYFVANMSYGEPTFQATESRFADLITHLVHDQGLVFTASAGNAGPALSTGGAPGSTVDAVMSVGAYVSPALAADAHAVRHAASVAAQYTWSSRGPVPSTGAVGVSVSAPGGAVSCVPRWTEQARQLMNGTSMASPCACGVAALVLSVAAAEKGDAVATPTLVRRALENTAAPVGGLKTGAPDGRLTYGAGLVQAAAAATYLLADLAAADPTRGARYDLSVRRADGGPAGRGLLLREPDDTAGVASVAATVTLTPRFHPRAAAADGALAVEQRLAIATTAPWLAAPPALLLPAGGRSCEVAVDVAALPPGSGLHFAEVEFCDAAAPGRGPLARLPVTVVRPLDVPAGGDLALGDVSMSPGVERRFFAAVPPGATWCVLRARPAGGDASTGRAPPRGFMLRLTAHAPHERYTDTEARTYATLGAGDEGVLVARVAGGGTVEATVAQFWSSAGGGLLSLDMSFHGLAAAPSAVALGPSSDAARVTVRASATRPERFAPRAQVARVRRALRPDAPGTVTPLCPDRDALPHGRRAHGLLLTHTLDVADGGGSYEFSLPLLSSLVYDSPLDGVTTIAHDAHKRRLGVSDAYPAKIKVPAGAGKVTLRTLVRSDDPTLLAGLATAPLQVDRLLDSKIDVPLYASHADAVRGTAAAGGGDGKKGGGGGGGAGGGGCGGGGGGAAVDGEPAAASPTPLKDRTLHTGERVAFFVGPLPDAKLPKDVGPGAVLIGNVTLGKLARRDGGKDAPGALPLALAVPPKAPAKPDAGKEEEEVDKEADGTKDGQTGPAAAARDAALRDALVSHLASLKPGADEAAAAAADALFEDALTGPHAGHLPLLAARVAVLASLQGAPRAARAAATVAAADAVAAAVDVPALHAAAARATPDDAPGAAARKKGLDSQKKALVDALAAKAGALQPADPATPTPAFTAAVADLRAWLGDDDPRAARLAAAVERGAGRAARALALLDKAVAKAGAVDRDAAAADAATRADLLDALGAPHAAAAARERARDAFPAEWEIF